MSRFSVDTAFRATDAFSATMRKMDATGSKVAANLKRNFAAVNGTLDSVHNGMKKVAAVGAVAGAVGVAGFSKMMAAGLEFDSQMVETGAKFGIGIRKGTDEYKKLQKVAEDVGAQTSFNATQAAGALKALASAGFQVDAAIAALPGVADFAVAAGIKDLAVASDMAGKSLGAFSMKSNDPAVLAANLTKLTDVMAKTADATSASMEGLFETIADGAPVAVMAGQSVETFMAMAGKLADAGIEGSVASTTLKNAMLLLAAPTKEAAAQLEKFHIKTKDADGNMRDALDIMQELGAATDKLGSADKAGALEHIFGKIPIAGIGALLGGGVSKIKELRFQLQGAAGTTKDFAAVVGDKLEQDLDGLSGALDGVFISLFNVSEGPMRNIVGRTTKWMEVNKGAISAGFQKSLTWLLKNFGLVVQWLKLIGKWVFVFYAMRAAISVATVALTAFQVASRIAAAITTVLAIATSRSWIMYGLMTAALWLDTAATYASAAAKGIWNGLQWIGLAAVAALGVATDAGTLKTAANTAVTWLSNTARAAWTAVTGLGTAALAAYNAGTLLSTIRMGALAAVTWLVNAASAALNIVLLANPYVLLGVAIVALIGYLFKLLGGWDLVSNAVKKFGSWAMSYIDPVVSKVKALFGFVSKTAEALGSLTGDNLGIPIPGEPAMAGVPGGFRMDLDSASMEPNTTSPMAGVSHAIQESMTTNKVELEVKVPQGVTAEAKGGGGKNVSVKVSQSGAGVAPGNG